MAEERKAGLGDIVVPGRECGECTACCQYPTVDTPQVQHFAGVLCTHCTAKKGCGIYERRPDNCRTWECGYRVLQFLDESWRPDRSGILLDMTTEDIPSGFGPVGIGIELIGGFELISSPRLANLIGTLIERKIPVFLRVPATQPGWAGHKIFLNRILAPIVATRNLQAVQESLRGALEAGVKAPKKKIFLKHAPIESPP